MLSPFVWVKDACSDYWDKYVALIDVAEENARLRDELRKAESTRVAEAEDKAELKRLRALLRLGALQERPGFAARIIAMRFGPQAALKTFAVDKGYVDGAVAETPVVTDQGVAGRVLRAAPHAATVLMLTDPGFRVAVVSQDSRTPGILTGVSGSEPRLEVSYVAQNAKIKEGELLVTAGMDHVFPKGIPVGVVTKVTPGNEILFLRVQARPVVDLEKTEEVILLQPVGSGPPLVPPPAADADARTPVEETAAEAGPSGALAGKNGTARPAQSGDAAGAIGRNGTAGPERSGARSSGAAPAAGRTGATARTAGEAAPARAAGTASPTGTGAGAAGGAPR